ncbi:beta-N-acetylhexosaminidase [Oryzihumus leptocrescens]|uniref:Beta-N-acetylhexosaminidase n=2 Tax=Oryzihumus leptocrescens TaxID=297536 RepID=A0A542ZII7_9MICO|nr:beta-N-acetylhexosaminidase [Oryzihumus leptocrescens]
MPSRHTLLASVTAATLLGAAAAGGCDSGPPRRAVKTVASRSPVTQPPSPTTSTSPTVVTPTRSAPPTATAPAPDPARTALARMTLAQRVGQLFMVGSPATSASPATLDAVSRLHVGNVMLTGRSRAGTAVPARTARVLRAATAGGVGMFVATDQEGGQVQVLSGPGLSTLPGALSQGGMAPARLQAVAAGWGRQLRAAGVNLDLAPVLDVVPGVAAARTNPPIGALGREYGYTPATVTSHGLAFAAGMRSAGVAVAAKHFPGLGRVHENTDTAASVTDRVTTRHDPFLAPFAAAVRAGAPFVMVSTATYTRVDPTRPAAFSPTVIGGMLRHDLGFGGVVISDDLANARQVSAWAPGARAVGFLAAGGDMVLVVDASPVAAMQRAVLGRAGADPAFRAKVDAAALRVLRAKAAAHLLP